MKNYSEKLFVNRCRLLFFVSHSSNIETFNEVDGIHFCRHFTAKSRLIGFYHSGRTNLLVESKDGTHKWIYRNILFDG